MEEKYESIWRHLMRGRFSWLLLVLVAHILFSGELANTARGQAESAVPMLLIFVAITYAARGGKKRLIITIVGDVLLVLCWAGMVVFPGLASKIVTYSVLLACMVGAVLMCLNFVLSGGAVGADHLCGAVCAYVLIAMAFATIYTIFWLLDPTSFNGMSPPDKTARPWAEMFYFSCTTLSTVGCGDIVPANFRSRSISIVEQLTGTFYVAVLIGRLAGLYPPRAPVASNKPYEKPPGG